ncbi:MAG: hypothetical protein COA79_17400 [Planctomycetota bacterium]|nr:MAG: hypothetical protein COA79_17400 [Planctomycetota bacterium]
MKKFHILIILCVFSLTNIFGQSVVNPWITTDRTVDCSSMKTIIKDVIKKEMTEEEKAIALYNFYRQRVYHFRNIAGSRLPLRTINVLGNTLCGSQGTCMKGILEAAGIKARVVSHPGHTFYEAFYDGKWHGYDTFANFYVFTKDANGKKYVASFAELNKDPSIITEAEKKGLNAPGWGPCGDKPIWFKAKTKVLNYKPLTSNWSVKDLKLRMGEEIVRTWWPQGAIIPGSVSKKFKTPHHTCGSKDRKNPEALFKFWEPYGIKNYEKVSISYRHYFNGFINYSPDLSSDAFKSQVAAKSIVIPVASPFQITAGRVYLNASCPTDADKISVSVAVKGDKWMPVFTSSKKGDHQFKADFANKIAKGGMGYNKYKLKIDIVGNATLKNIYVRTVFVHNAMSAPHLMPGNNKITIATKVADLSNSKLKVIYRYKEAPAWDNEKVIEKEITSSPTTFEVKLADTKKLPQMQDLTMRNGKINWMPGNSKLTDKVLCDFSKEASLSAWGADKPLVKAFAAGGGMLISSTEKSQYPQASMRNLKEDWRSYKSIVIELENLGETSQNVIFRARSNSNNKERSDVSYKVRKGKFTMNIPMTSLSKVKLDNITKIYLMFAGIPETGCKIKINKITLLVDKSL